jgi:hypothetical protein
MYVTEALLQQADKTLRLAFCSTRLPAFRATLRAACCATLLENRLSQPAHYLLLTLGDPTV